MKIITAQIDLSKIDKSRIVKTDKSGQPFKNGQQFYDVTIILNDEADKFGQDVSISNGQTKEEREAKAKRTFIGNGKTVFSKEPEQKETPASNQTSSGSASDDDLLPF